MRTATIDAIVFPSLSSELNDDQRRNKVKNLLGKLRKDRVIHYEPKGENKGWVLG